MSRKHLTESYTNLLARF